MQATVEYRKQSFMSDDDSLCSAQERVESVKANFERDPRTRQLMDLSNMEEYRFQNEEEEAQSIESELEHLKLHEDTLRSELAEVETSFQYRRESRDDPEECTSVPPKATGIPDLVTTSYSESLASSASEEELLPISSSASLEKILSSARWQTVVGGINLTGASDMWAAHFYAKLQHKKRSGR